MFCKRKAREVPGGKPNTHLAERPGIGPLTSVKRVCVSSTGDGVGLGLR